MEFATVHWRQANAYLSFGTLDSAYVDYLLAFTVVANIIPKCPDFPTFKTVAGRPYQEFEALKRVCLTIINFLYFH
jgi:ubiquitin carboxyl-terminal hydrolase 8